MPSIRPTGPPGEPRPTNQAHVQAQGAWFTVPGMAFGADLLNLDAELVDRTPEDPLTPLAPGSFDVKVRAAELQVHPSQVRDALRSAAGGLLRSHGLSDTDVTLRPDATVRVSASLKRAGVKWPVRLDFKLERRDPDTVALVPQLNAFTRWGLGVLGLDLAEELATLAPGARVEPGGGVAFDLRALPYVQAQVRDIVTEDGKLRVRLGEAAAMPPRERRNGATNWIQLEARGEVAIPDANLRNGRVFVRSSEGPDRPIYLNDIPKDATVRREAGEVVLTRDSIITALKQQVPALQLDQVRFEGSRLHLVGTYRVPSGVISGLLGLFVGGVAGLVAGMAAGDPAQDLKVPVREAIDLAVTPDGNLRLTPDAGSMHASTIRDELARLVGARREGEGVVLDFSKLGELEVGRIKRLREERGQLVLSF